MCEELALERLIKRIKQSFAAFPDPRTGKNTQYEMIDAGMGAFSVFFTQSPSFLGHQQGRKRSKGRCKAESLFGMDQIPSDNQMRSLLDPVAPSDVSPVFRDIYQRLERAEGWIVFDRKAIVCWLQQMGRSTTRRRRYIMTIVVPGVEQWEDQLRSQWADAGDCTAGERASDCTGTGVYPAARRAGETRP